MEAFKVGTTLELRDLVGPRIAALIKEFDRLEQKANQTKRSLRLMGAEASGIREAARGVQALHRDMVRAQVSAERMAASFGKFEGRVLLNGLRGLNGEYGRATAGAQAFNVEMRGITALVPELRAASTTMANMARHIGTASLNASILRSHLGGVALAAGSIPNLAGIVPAGARAAAARAGGGGHGGGIHGGNVHMGPGGMGVGAVGFAAPGVVVPLVAGYLGYRGVKAAAHEAGEYQREQALFSMYGLSEQANADAKRFAASVHVVGTSMQDTFRIFTEAQGVFRGAGLAESQALTAAKMVTPQLAKLRFADQSLTGRTMSEADEKSFLRYVETSGGLHSPEKFNQILETALKVKITSGGNVNYEELRQFMRTGGIAAKGLSEATKAGWFEPIIGEMRGGAAGTALMTAYQRMNGLIKLPNQALHEFLRLGLWRKEDIVLNKNGGLDHVKEGRNPLIHADEYAANPLKYHMERVMPIYRRMHLTQDQIDRENALLYGRTGSNMYGNFERQIETILASVKGMLKVPGVDPAVEKGKKTLSGAEQDFQAAWSDFNTVFGDKVLPGVTDMLKIATAFMRSAAAFIDHPIDSALRFMQHYAPDGGGGAIPLPGMGSSDGSASRPSVVPPGSSQSLKVHTQVNLDGKKLGEVVSEHMTKNLGTRFSGGFDPAIGLLPSGLK